jgi:hypothetical protein
MGTQHTRGRRETHPGFWWQNELETWLGRVMDGIWNILCLFAMLKRNKKQ